MRAAVDSAHTKCATVHTGCSPQGCSSCFCSLLHVYTALLANPQYASASEQTRASLRIFHQKVTVRLPEPHTFLQLFSALL